MIRFQNTEAKKEVATTEEGAVKPYQFSPFQMKFKDNKADYALARVDDLLNFARRVNMKNFFITLIDIFPNYRPL